ncbi:glutaredoxin family protein [Aquipuribacter nitratireducens]|uniref:Glutaredoxin family protein n=1 Tax=Aquipuribacter nitratireducens TaxID=650104 RepID=A0ABW0GS30_9MICO
MLDRVTDRIRRLLPRRDAAAAAGARVPEVRLVGRRGCHLCDEARPVVARECARVGARLQEASVDDDPRLHAAYWDRIPVVEVDGRVVEQLRVDAERLRRVLAAAARGEGPAERLTW